MFLAFLKHVLLAAMLALGTIGLQRGTTQNILTTAAGATAQTGSVFALPQDWSPSDEIAVEIVISGGTFSALTVNVALSLDGVNFPINQLSDASHANNFTVLESGATANFLKAPFIQASITGGVVATGSPVVSVNIWPR